MLVWSLAAGLAANVTIAWLGAATLTIDTTRDINRRVTVFFAPDEGLNYDHYHGKVLGEVLLLKMRDWDAQRTQRFGRFDTRQWPSWAFDNRARDADSPHIGHQYEAYGWPWRSMALGWFWQSPGEYRCQRGWAIGADRCDDDLHLPRALPLGVIVPGFIGNTILFAAMAGAGLLVLRRGTGRSAD